MKTDNFYQPTKAEADRCMTHHAACDCREYAYQQRIRKLEAELAHERYLRNRDNDELVKYQKKIEAENQRLREVLGDIANGGCGLGQFIPRDEKGKPPYFKACTEVTDDKSDWCWCCIAKAALLREGE